MLSGRGTVKIGDFGQVWLGGLFFLGGAAATPAGHAALLGRLAPRSCKATLPSFSSIACHAPPNALAKCPRSLRLRASSLGGATCSTARWARPPTWVRPQLCLLRGCYWPLQLLLPWLAASTMAPFEGSASAALPCAPQQRARSPAPVLPPPPARSPRGVRRGELPRAAGGCVGAGRLPLPLHLRGAALQGVCAVGQAGRLGGWEVQDGARGEARAGPSGWMGRQRWLPHRSAPAGGSMAGRRFYCLASQRAAGGERAGPVCQRSVPVCFCSV